jgi:protein-disulfide isomerase
MHAMRGRGFAAALLLALLGVVYGGFARGQGSQTDATTYDVANVAQNDVLNVRAQPGANQPLIGSIPHNGRGIQFLGETRQVGQSEWKRVQYGVVGWVNSGYLAVEPGANAYSVTNVAQDDVLFVRERPGADQAEVGSIPFNGSGIRYLGQREQVGNSVWARVQYQLTGWVNSSYLSPTLVAGPGPQPSTSTEAQLLPVFGAAGAPNTLKVWGSYTCPFTSRLVIEILMPIVRDSNGTVNVEWHHFPIHNTDPSFHVVGYADPAKFWQYLYAVMMAARQDDNLQLNVSMARIIQLAGAVGISEARVKSAYDNQSSWNAVRDDLLAGKVLGVTGTPGLFYSGYFLTPEGLPRATAEFDSSLRRMLNVPLRQ